MEHYLDAKKCYDNDTKAAQYSQESSYLSQAMQGEFPNVVNDHDWISSEELLVREGDKAKEGLLKVQSDFHNEELNDSMCDVEVIGGEDGVKNQWREVLRCCLLCPASCAPEVSWRPCPGLDTRSADKEPGPKFSLARPEKLSCTFKQGKSWFNR